MLRAQNLQLDGLQEFEFREFKVMCDVEALLRSGHIDEAVERYTSIDDDLNARDKLLSDFEQHKIRKSDSWRWRNEVVMYNKETGIFTYYLKKQNT